MTVAIGCSYTMPCLFVMAGRFTADGWLFIEVVFFDCKIIAADYAGWIADNFGKAWYT
jgi:hypothetical protein